MIFGAVGDSEGTIRYTPHPYSFLCQAAGEKTIMPEVQMEAPVIRLDSLMDELGHKPDLIKMDVDGAEMAALTGAEQVLSNPELTMFLEVHPAALPKFGSSAAEVGEFLSARGFSLYLVEEFREVSQTRLTPIKDLSGLSTPSGDMLVVTRRSISDLGLSL